MLIIIIITKYNILYNCSTLTPKYDANSVLDLFSSDKPNTVKNLDLGFSNSFWLIEFYAYLITCRSTIGGKYTFGAIDTFLVYLF